MSGLGMQAAGRKPLRYKRPSSSWVTVVVLAFASVGAATIGASLVRRLGWFAVQRPAAPPPAQPTAYKPIPRDDAVLVTIDVSPADARLMLDGEPLPSNPVRLPRRPQPHKLAAIADGYAPSVTEVVPDRPKTVKVRLRRSQ